MSEYEDSNKVKLGDLIAITWRHKVKFLSVFLPIMAATVYLAVATPAVYLSSATLLVEAQELPESTVKSAVGGYVEARLVAIEKRILSSVSLYEIAKNAGVPEDNITIEFVKNMRDLISRETTVIDSPDPRGSSSLVSFTVYFEDKDPAFAQKIASQLADLYIEENSKLRISMAQDAVTFLEDEGARLKGELNEIESKLAEFKKENFGSLPENLTSNLAIMDKTDVTLEGLDQRIMQLESEKIELDRRLLVSEGAQGRELIQQILNEKKVQYSQLKLQYREAHPDVQALKSEIEDLEQALSTGEYSQLEQKQLLEVSPVARASDSAATISIKTRLEQIRNELQHEKAQRESWLAKKAEFEKRLSQSPTTEQEYQNLQRELTNAKDALSAIKGRQMSARLSLQLENKEKAERFVVIEPANLPTSPYKPNRPALMLLGFVLALGSGVLSIALGQRYSSSIIGVKGVMAVLKEPPLVTIPVIDKKYQ